MLPGACGSGVGGFVIWEANYGPNYGHNYVVFFFCVCFFVFKTGHLLFSDT